MIAALAGDDPVMVTGVVAAASIAPIRSCRWPRGCADTRGGVCGVLFRGQHHKINVAGAIRSSHSVL
jgi:hypothetical protein